MKKKESLIEELEKVNVDGKLDTIIEINEEIKKSCFEFSEKLRHTIENEKILEDHCKYKCRLLPNNYLENNDWKGNVVMSKRKEQSCVLFNFTNSVGICWISL